MIEFASTDEAAPFDCPNDIETKAIVKTNTAESRERRNVIVKTAAWSHPRADYIKLEFQCVSDLDESVKRLGRVDAPFLAIQ